MGKFLKKLFSKKSPLTAKQAGEFTAHLLTSKTGFSSSADEVIDFLEDSDLSVHASKAHIKREVFPFNLYCAYTIWASRHSDSLSEIYEGIISALSKIRSQKTQIEICEKLMAILDAEEKRKVPGSGRAGDKENPPIFYAAWDVSIRMFGSEQGQDLRRIVALTSLGVGIMQAWANVIDTIKIVDTEMQKLDEFLRDVNKTLPKGQSCINRDML